MTVQRVSFQQNVGNVYTAEEMRRVLKLLANRRDGVNGAGDYAVSQNGTPNLSVNVAAGEADVNGSETLQQGSYYLYNDAVVNRTIASSDPTNPRRDLVVLRVRDQFYSGTFNDGDLVVVTGTPAPSPVDPAAPANSLILARVAVAPNATAISNANITDLRVWQAQKLFPGPNGLHVRNSGDTLDTLYVDNSGFVFPAGAISVPPAFGSALAPSSYGSVPVKIDEQLLSAGAASVRFPASGTLPQGFRQLLLEATTKSDQASSQSIYPRFNGDAGTNYDTQFLAGGGASPTAGSNIASSTPFIGNIPPTAAAAGWGFFILEILNYTSTAQFKAFMCRSGYNNGAGGMSVQQSFGDWTNAPSAAAISFITLFPGAGLFAAGSLFTLYGLP